MCRKLMHLVLVILALGVGSTGPARAELVAHWAMDDATGNTALDSAGRGHNGTVNGTPNWVVGQNGGALDFNGSSNYIDIGGTHPIVTGSLSLAMWIKARGIPFTSGYQMPMANDSWTAGSVHVHVARNTSVFNVDTNGGTDIPSITVLQAEQWYHVAATLDAAGSSKIYINGVLDNSTTGAAANYFIGPVNLGSYNTSRYLNGVLDDVRIYNHVLSAKEVHQIMNPAPPGTASAPNPVDEAEDVLQDVVLSWKPGAYAATHDVYFGTSFADVNNAGKSDPLGVLAGAGQDANTFDPAGLLEFGRTYYWRVDEVNAAPDSTVFKGDVWSFTVEPYAYPLTNITATASSSHTAQTGPEKTIDGSGLDAADLHDTTDGTMWLSNTTGPKPPWIQYEFDRVYKLQEMRVWNSNQLIESFAGLGARSVTIEHSTDGTTWTTLAGVLEFAKAPGAPGYAYSTTVDFGGIAAKYVKLTINSNWSGGLFPQCGLSEVRFYHMPVRAREPKPASAATGTRPDVVLSWRAGREAVSHQVYLSTDSNAVANGTAPVVTQTEARYAPSALELGATYYWKVVEVNQAASPTTWESDVWSFSTIEYVVIDDFESYTNESPNRLFQAWIDGYGFSADEFFPTGNPGNGTGSGVGHDIWTSGGVHFGRTIAETTTVHGGRQSMPLYYTNTSIPTSEAERTWKTAQDWTANGADTLNLYLRGTPVGFAELSPSHILMNGMGTDIYSTADQGRFVYKQLNGNGTIIARVDRLDATNPWAKAGVMIRRNLDPGSTWAYSVYAPGNGCRFQTRPTVGGPGASDTAIATPAQIAVRAPVWVKLERTGDQFNAYYATAAAPATWIASPWNPQTLAMDADVYIGLAVTSHAAGVVTQAEFSGVATTGNVTGQWQSVSLTVEQPAGNLLDPLYLTVEDTGGRKATVVHTDPLAVGAGTWTQWTIPLSTFTSAGVKTDSIKKMVIGVGDKSKPASQASGLIYIDDIGYGRPASQ